MSVDAVAAVAWRRIDRMGLEHCALRRTASGWTIDGTVLVVLEEGPHRIEYGVACDEVWRTRRVDVRIEAVGAAPTSRSLALRVDGDGDWRSDGRAVDAAEGCVDVDLAFTPSTNTLPIRRLALTHGAAAGVDAAWVRAPDLGIARLGQRYTRVGARRYLYESDTGFVAEIDVDDDGLVVAYPGLWERLNR